MIDDGNLIEAPTLPGFLEPAPFAALKKQVEGLRSLSREEKISVLSACSLAALEVVEFDESWYLSAYPDIQAAVRTGAFTSGFDHYQTLGYFEGRIPTDIFVDEEFYCHIYPDVGKAINLGLLPSAKIHFLTKGYHEGRIPSSRYSFGRLECREGLEASRKKSRGGIV